MGQETHRPFLLPPTKFMASMCALHSMRWNHYKLTQNPDQQRHLTFPVQLTPFQIQKYTRTQAMASVIASGTRISPGFSKPSVIWCILRLYKHIMRHNYTSQQDTYWTHVFSCTKVKESHDKILLPKLIDSAGEIGGVYYAVVCVTSVCIPCIVTRFPWKLLQRAEECFTFLFLNTPPKHSPNYIFKACKHMWQGLLTVEKELYK